jgi:hypothetical protein
MAEAMAKDLSYQSIVSAVNAGEDIADLYGDYELLGQPGDPLAERLLYVDMRLRYIEAFRDVRGTVEATQAAEPDFMADTASDMDTFGALVRDAISHTRARFSDEVESEAPTTLSDSAVSRWGESPELRTTLGRVLLDEEYTSQSSDNMTNACRTTISAVSEGLWAVCQAAEHLERSDPSVDSSTVRQACAEAVREEFERIEGELQMAQEVLEAVDDRTPEEGSL